MNPITNEEWINKFTASLHRRFPGRSTALHYENDLHQFLRSYSGCLSAVKSADIDAFVDQQRAQGLAPATIKRRVAALKTFFDFLATELDDPGRPNPVSLRRHAGRQPQRLPRDLRDDEVERLLAVVEQPREMALIVLLLYGGLRIEEAVTLTPAAISVPSEAAQPVRVRVLGKGRKERIVYLPRSVYAALPAYQQTLPIRDPHQPLLRNQRGEPLTIAGAQWILRQLAQQSGVAVTAHRLRHTCARWLAEGEMPLLALARFLGHTSLHSTQRYIDGADPQVRRAYEAAMDQAGQAEPAPAVPSPAPTRAAPVTTPASVVRTVPARFVPPDWLATWPAWLRHGVEAWLARCWFDWTPSRRQANAARHLRSLRSFWSWQLAQRPLRSFTDLTTADVQAFIEAELARGLSPVTVKTVLNRLYGLLGFLHQRGECAQIPPRPPLRLPDSLPRHLAPSELVALERYVHHQSQQAQPPWLPIALYYLLAHGGLRICEALDVQATDLDVAQRRLWVRQGKDRRDRVVYLTQTAADALAHYQQTVPHAAADLLFSRQGQPLTYEQAWRCIRSLGEAAGVIPLSPLRLRHTYATTLLNNGMTLEALRQMMGHTHLNTTLIYARLADTTVEAQYRQAMEPLTNFVAPYSL